MARRILEVFNRYRFLGGEEKAADDIHAMLQEDHEVERCHFDSQTWLGPNAPGKFGQLRRLFYNPESRDRFESEAQRFRAEAALFHNIYPIGSPSLYHAAQRTNLPVIQYAHNFRPFSVGGTLYVNGQILEEPLRGDFWRETRLGAWQGSVIRSAAMALALKSLHRKGWLDSVKAWICVSEFMRRKFIEAGLPPSRVFTLLHAWRPLPEAPAAGDEGHYLCLARLVPEKGIGVLLEAWAKLQSELGEDKTPLLYIAGEGPMTQQVEAAMRAGLRIRYPGMVTGEAKAHLIRGCRAMIIPSVWWEPLGLVTYEAYDYGKPVLAAASGGLTETVQHGVTGYSHRPGDPEDLAKTVLQMEEASSDTRHQMGKAGREWLLRETSIAGWRQKFTQILESSIASRDGG